MRTFVLPDFLRWTILGSDVQNQETLTEIPGNPTSPRIPGVRVIPCRAVRTPYGIGVRLGLVPQARNILDTLPKRLQRLDVSALTFSV